MATGDDALAAGMDIMTGSEPANTLDTEVNLTRDYIAQRTSTVTPVSKGGTGATSASGARTNLGASEVGHTHAWGDITGKPSSFPPSTHSHSWGQITGKPTTFPPSGHSHVWANISDRDNIDMHNIGARYGARVSFSTRVEATSFVASGNGTFGGAWGNNITSDRRAVWMQSDGTLGHTASSARYKKNVRPWDGLTDEQFAALSVVTYQWRNAVNPSDHTEVGLIAEALDALGLTWAVFYDEQGRPDGVHYDLIVLAVIPYVQTLAARVAALEAAA